MDNPTEYFSKLYKKWMPIKTSDNVIKLKQYQYQLR